MSKTKILMFLIITAVIARFSFPTTASTQSEDKIENTEKQEVSLTKVRVKEFEVQYLEDFFTLYQSPEPIKSSMLFSKYEGDIVEILAKQGDIVKAGTPIMRIKEKGSSSNLIAAKFNLQQSEVEFKAAEDLYKQKLTPKTEYLFKKSSYEKAKSLYEQAIIELEDSTIKAPFTGVIANFDYEIGQFIEKNTQVGFIHDLSRLKVKIQIPEKYISEVKVGNKVILKGIKEIKGSIDYVSLVANKETQSFESEVITDQDDSMNNIAGLTYTVNVFIEPKKGLIIPSSVILLKDSKQFIRAIDKENKVIEIPIEIFKDSKEGLWVKIDYPDSKIKLITVGQNLVKENEKVEFYEDKGM